QTRRPPLRPAHGARLLVHARNRPRAGHRRRRHAGTGRTRPRTRRAHRRDPAGTGRRRLMTTPTGGGRRVASVEYLAGIVAAISPLPPVRTPVGESSAGLVTAEPVRAGLPAPAFTNSAMDGFALRAADLAAVGDGTHAWLP